MKNDVQVKKNADWIQPKQSMGRLYISLHENH